MSDAIGQILPLAVGVALSAVPIIAVVLMLATPQARGNGLAFVFVLLGTLGPGIPVGIYVAMGDRAGRVLEDLKSWLAANNAAIMAVLGVVIGAKLLGDGISGLS